MDHKKQHAPLDSTLLLSSTIYITIQRYKTTYTLYFSLLHFTSIYSAIHQQVPLDTTVLPSSAPYITIQRYTTIFTPRQHYTSRYCSLHHNHDSSIQQYVPLSNLDRHNRIHTSKFSNLSGHALCLSPRFIKYSMKTFASFKENTAFSSAVMTRHDSS